MVCERGKPGAESKKNSRQADTSKNQTQESGVNGSGWIRNSFGQPSLQANISISKLPALMPIRLAAKDPASNSSTTSQSC